MPSTLGASPAWGTAVMGDWLHIGSSGGGDSGTKGSSSLFFFFLHHRGVSMSLCLTLVSSQKETSNLSASKFSGRFWLTPADLSIHSSFPRVSLRTTADFVSPRSCESSIPLVDPTLGTLDFDFCPGSWTCQWPQVRITWSPDPHTIGHCVVKPGCSVKDIDHTYFPKPAMGLQDTAYPEKRSTDSLVEGLRSGCRCHSWVLTTLLPDLAKYPKA